MLCFNKLPLNEKQVNGVFLKTLAFLSFQSRSVVLHGTERDVAMVVGADGHHARLVGSRVALADVGGDAEDGERLIPPLRQLFSQGAQLRLH